MQIVQLGKQYLHFKKLR